MSAVLLQRWKNGYELFMTRDYNNALNVFELIELSCTDKTLIPKEITFNKILTLIALNEHSHPVEVGSKLLRSDLGPFFLFAVGVHQEMVDPETSISFFKKCLLSLRDSDEKRLTDHNWILTKFFVLINLAIMSNNAQDSKMSDVYLVKAKDLANDEESQRIVQKYLENGLEGASCIGFPADLCIAPPGYKEVDVQDRLTVPRKDAVINETEFEKTQKEKVTESSSTRHMGNRNSDAKYNMLPTPPLETDKSYFRDDKTEAEPPSPPFYRYLEKPKAIKTLSSAHSSTIASNIYSPIDSPTTPQEDQPETTGEYFSEIAYVQIFGIWRPFAVLLDGKVMKLCNEKKKSQVDIEIPLDGYCMIEPAPESSFRKLHLFKLVSETDTYLFALESLTTSLQWISKIMKVSQDLPLRPKEVKLLKTGLGRAPFTIDQ